MANEDARKAIRTIADVIERARAKRAAAGEESPFPEQAQDVLDVIEHLAERVKTRREAEAAGVKVPPELKEPLAQWHGLVQDEARRRIAAETREQATDS